MLHTSSKSTSHHSTHHPLLISTALKLTQSGISVVATGEDKIPVGGKWGHLQNHIARPEELDRMFGHPKATGIAIIGGRVSGNLINLDFEGKDHSHTPMESVYPDWDQLASEALTRLGMADLFEKIPVTKTQHGGYHVRWRVVGETDIGNDKLAKRWAVHPETGHILTDKKGKPIADLLIESKGEGGYALCPPSPGYELISGDLTQIPTLPIGVHELLLSIAKSFHTAIDDQRRVTSPQHESNPCSSLPIGKSAICNPQSLKPGDDYNQRGDWRSVLQRAGWELIMTRGEQEYWKRPGTSNRWSATFSTTHNLFYVFSSNASPFEAEKAYSPFAIHALLHHDGDFSAAAKDLSAQGYGSHNGNPHPSQRHGNNGTGATGRYAPFTATAPPGVSGNGRNGRGGTTGADNPHEPEKDPLREKGTPTLIETFDKATAADFLDRRTPVIINNRQMRHVVVDMQAIILDYDKEPQIYQKDGRLVRVTFQKDRATLNYFTPDTLALTLNEYADFYKARETKDGVIFTPAIPPLYLAKGILHAPRHHVPELDFISASPLFAPDGSVATAEGYNPKVSAYLHLSDEMKITDADINPTPENVDKSKALIEEMIAEFPFDSEASRQNAISLLLMPFIRPLVNAEIPLYACDSSDPGTGKGLLIDSLLTPYLSHRPISNSEVFGDEWRKQLTTLLEHNPDVVYFDNAQKIDSTALASALTKGYWQDRRLGKNELSTSEIRAIFVVNGNNLEIGGEIARRVVWIRMVPNTEDPEERTFRISDLRGWVADHRRELVIAALTLINHWVKGGMKAGDLRMGSFSRWASIMSGVMAAVGYDQFMTNIPQLKSRVDTTRDAMREFVGGWYNTYQTQEVNAQQLLRLASVEVDDETGEEVGEGLLSELLTANSKRGRANQLRNLLRKHTDRTFRLEESESDAMERKCKIENSGKRINGYMIYRLTPIRHSSEPPFDSDAVHLGTTEQFTSEEHRDDARASDSSEPRCDAVEKTSVSSDGSEADAFPAMNAPERSEDSGGTRTDSPERSENEGVFLQEEAESEARDDSRGSLGEMRFTSDVPSPDGDGVSGQVNLEVNLDANGSPAVERGSLDDASHNGTQQKHPIENGEGLSVAEDQAIEYVRSWLTSQATLYVKGTCEDLSPYQVAYIRSEANRQFGTDLVHEDIEAIWACVVNAAMPAER